MGLSIYLLGTFRVMIDQQPVDLRRRKAIALLAYLSATNQPHTRDHLAALLWPEHSDARALAYLRNALWIVTQHIDKAFIDADDLTIGLRQCDALHVDVLAFRQLAESTPPTIENLRAACDIYGGDFMTGFNMKDAAPFEAWHNIERQALQQQYIATLHRLTENYRATGQIEEALQTAQRWSIVDPLDEGAQMALIALYSQAGKRRQAAQQYDAYKLELERELQITPSTAMQDLAETMLKAPPQLPGFALPAPTTSFIGRSHETQAAIDLLMREDCRLLTITGTGGIGKTRLALHIAHTLKDSFAHGAAFIPLDELKNGDFIPASIAATVGCYLDDNANHLAQLINFLQDKHMLIVLDNFEHLLDEAVMVTRILTAAPHVLILTTSRELLNLSGEWTYKIGGLSCGGSEADSDGYRLFDERVARVRNGRGLCAEERQAAMQICAMLGGMPLALELTASWLMTLSCQQVVDLLADGIDALYTTAQDVPAKHQNIWAVFSRCWDALSAEDQMHYAQLSVFNRPFTPQSAAAIVGITAAGLHRLVSKSLLEVNDARHYHLHPLLREFAAHKLSETADALHATRDRHAQYYANVPPEALPEDMLEICAALDWANERGQLSVIAGLTRLMRQFYETWGWHIATTSTHELFEQAANVCEQHESAGELVADLYRSLSHLYRVSNQSDRARQAHEKARTYTLRSE